MQLSFRRLFAQYPLAPGDSLVMIPIRDELVEDITVFGNNSILPVLTDKTLKIIF